MSLNLLKEIEKLEETKKQITEESTEEQIEKNTPVQENLLKDNQPLYVKKEEPAVKEEIKTVNLFSASAFQEAESNNQNQKESVLTRQNLFQPKIEKKEEVLEEKNEQVEQKESSEEVEEELFEIKAKPKPKKKLANFRMKLFTAVFCAVMVLTSGWVVANIVRINNVNQAISSSQTTFNANEIKLIKNIEKLDDLDSQNPEDNTSLELIDEIITVQPLPLENPTDYQETSNWFDAVCNWISGLFGG